MESFTTSEIAELAFSQIRDRCVEESKESKEFLKAIKLFSSSY